MKARIVLLVIFIIAMIAFTQLTRFSDDFTEKSSLHREMLDETFPSETEEKSQAQEVEVTEEKAAEEVPSKSFSSEQVKRGYQVFHDKGSCYTCHGDKAEGMKENRAPLLAGQHDWYVYSQLVAFKNGERKNEDMEPFIAELTDQEFQDVALYIAQMGQSN